MMVVCLISLLAGCASTNVSLPQRTGIEQLLLSNAVDEALRDVVLEDLRGKKVYVEEKYLESYDIKYVIGSVRDMVSQQGCKLVNTIEDAEIILEIRSGALGIDSSAGLFGTPSLPIVVPGAGNLSIPEMSIYSSQKSDSISKLLLLAYDKKGRHIYSSGPLVGQSNFSKYRFFLIVDLNFTDIPERQGY